MIRSVAEFIEMNSSDDANIRRRAVSEEASEEIWFELIENYPELRFAIALNKNLTAPVLDVLSRDTDLRVRYIVAKKRKVSAEILHRLAFDPEESIRMQVARHGNASKQTLEILRNDSWSEISRTAGARLAQR